MIYYTHILCFSFARFLWLFQDGKFTRELKNDLRFSSYLGAFVRYSCTFATNSRLELVFSERCSCVSNAKNLDTIACGLEAEALNYSL